MKQARVWLKEKINGISEREQELEKNEDKTDEGRKR